MAYTGQSVRRFEDPRLLTGQGSYVDDIKLPGLLHAAVLRSPHAHANIRSIDGSTASRLPGVVAVFTAADIQDLAVEIPTRTNTGADEFNPPRHPILASDKVCYVGQAVAVVIAEDPYSAADALEQILVDYETLPAVIDPDQATEEAAIVPALAQLDELVAAAAGIEAGTAEGLYLLGTYWNVEFAKNPERARHYAALGLKVTTERRYRAFFQETLDRK